MSENSGLRERQLRDELRRLAAEMPDEAALSTFSGRLIQTQMTRRAEDVRQNLDELVDRQLVVRLTDPRDQHAINTGLLAQILSRFQTAVDHIGWALRAGPGIEGRPPATIANRTATEVLALAPGSFEVVLRGSTLEFDLESDSDEEEGELGSLLEASLSRVLALARAASEETFTDSIIEMTQELGGMSTRRLSLWFQKLAENSLTTNLVPAGHPEDAVTVTPAQARALSEWLSHVQDTVKTLTVRGVLRVADDVRGRFGLEDAAGHLYEGKSAPELVQHKEIGVEYVAEIHVTVTVAKHTSARSERYNLVSLAPV